MSTRRPPGYSAPREGGDRDVAILGAQSQRELSRHAQVSARLSTDELWLRYFALGGTAGPVELDAYLNSALDLPAEQRDRVSLAINEHIDATVATVRAPYVRPLRSAADQGPALAALRDLLRKTHLVPPDALPAAVDTAASHLGITAVVYLADYATQTLVPFPGRHGRDRAELNIGSTLAGRAYRRAQMQIAASHHGPARLWAPIIDGVELLGVLEVMVEDPPDLHEPVLHEQLWSFTHYLGHLITVLDPLGDAIDAVRRTRERTIEAELVWTLLPPLTGGTDKVLVSARLEPAHDLGGDIFDYALSPTRARFALIDATGHNLRAGLAAAACVASYRNARRHGQGLFAQAETIHRTLVEHFSNQMMYATAVLGDLDLDSGLLRYVDAGHPPPLLLRNGKVVKTLDQGRRPMLGLDASGAAPGEERLEPGDTIVLYTDGITEARDTANHFFGLGRLIDTIEHAAADRRPLPEMVQNLFQAILHHQGASSRTTPRSCSSSGPPRPKPPSTPRPSTSGPEIKPVWTVPG